MAGRGATTFQKRQKEQLRKEKREAKLARRQGKQQAPSASLQPNGEENPEESAQAEVTTEKSVTNPAPAESGREA